MSLQSMMLRAMLDYPPSTMATLTGDGKGHALGKGFLADLRRAKKLGWEVEVYAWDTSCNRYLKDFAVNEGKFVSLENYYESITFLKDVRVVRPLVLS